MKHYIFLLFLISSIHNSYSQDLFFINSNLTSSYFSIDTSVVHTGKEFVEPLNKLLKKDAAMDSLTQTDPESDYVCAYTISWTSSHQYGHEFIDIHGAFDEIKQDSAAAYHNLPPPRYSYHKYCRIDTLSRKAIVSGKDLNQGSYSPYTSNSWPGHMPMSFGKDLVVSRFSMRQEGGQTYWASETLQFWVRIPKKD